MTEVPTILLLIETSRGYGRGLLRGIIQWRQLHRPCHLVVSTAHYSKRLPKLDSVKCSGIIANITSLSFCESVQKLNVPTIVTEPSFNQLAKVCDDLHAGMIVANHRAIVKMACDYFIENQHKNLAYCGIPEGWWSKNREKEFVSYLAERSIIPHVYSCSHIPRKQHHWEEDAPLVARWLRQLPRPVAVLACNDDRGRHLLDICNREKIAVPEEVAILGVDNDDLECELTQPSLSSIALNVASTGYKAMELLMGAMDGRNIDRRNIYDEPIHVTERQSTGIVFSNDEYVTHALKYIRDNYLYPIQVTDVVHHVGISRRSLERRFVVFLNRTIMDEILMRRLERAKQLLVNTNDLVVRIAIASGFDHLQPMLRIFREKMGCTPSEYRKLNVVSKQELPD